jgi:hypothetical protein
MALNVNGGSLEWQANIDLNTALKQLDLLGEKFSQALNVDPSTSLTDLLKSKFTELTKQAQIFSDGLQNVKEPAAIKQLTDGLNQTKIQLGLVDTLMKQFGGGFKPEQATDKILTLRGQLNAVRSELGLMLKAQAEGGAFDAAKFERLTEQGRELSNAYNNVNKELHLASSNVAGLEALREGFRGLIGSAEAFTGVMGLFTTDQAKAEEITKNLVALMSILNGVEEVGALLAKNSALNAFLRRTALFSQAEGAAAATAGEAALAGVEAEGIVATEAATAAQLGLNAAMLANPVGIILAAIVAIIGAWELYTHTIGKASDEEERHKAATEAMMDAMKKAADEVGKEEAALAGLIAQARNENLTREQRQTSVNQANSKYPEYLNNLTLENAYSDGINASIEKQVELLRQKANAQAAEAVYADKLKAVVNAQTELNRVVQNGGTFFEKLWASARSTNGADSKMVLIADKTDALTEAQNQANGALEAFTQIQTAAGQAMQSNSDKIQVQIDNLKSLELITGNKQFYQSLIDGLEGQVRLLKQFETRPFDINQFNENKKQLEAETQERLSKVQKGTQAEIEIRRKAAKQMLDLEKQNQGAFDASGKPINRSSDQFNPKPDPEALRALAKYNSDLESINEEARAKALRNISAAASAAAIQLQAIGMQTNESYFDAQEIAIRKAAKEQINSAKDNAGEIRKIQAQLNLDLSNLDIQRKQTRLTHEQEIQQVLLNNVRAGSQQELDIRLTMLDIARDKELTAAGKDQTKITELYSTTEKAKLDLRKAYAIEAAQTETNIQLAKIETQLAKSQEGSFQELLLKKQEIDKKAQLEEENLQKNIKNQDLLAAKTLEIYAKSLQDKKKLDDEYNQKQLELQLKAVQARTDLANASLTQIINSPTATPNQKFNAQREELQNNIAALQKQDQIITANIIAGKGDIDKLDQQATEVEAKLKDLQGQLVNLDSQQMIDNLKKASGVASALATGFGSISNALKEVNPGLADLIDGLSGVANIASDALSAIASFASGDVAGGIGAAAKAVTGIISSLVGNQAAELAHQKEIKDFLTKVYVGEQEINLLYEERARQQVLINKLRLQGMRDERTLLEQQKTDIQKQFETVFTELQKETFDVVKHIKDIGVFTGVDIITPTPLLGKTFAEIEQLFIKGQLSGKAKDLFEELQKIKQAGVDVDALLQKNTDQADQLFTGTTAQNIADTIKQGLESGKRSAADFADTFQNLMQQAILSSFEAKAIEPLIADFYKQFAQLTEANGGNLTKEQVAQLKEKFGKDVASITEQFQQLQDLTGITISGNGANSNSLSGAIKGITEQTAELLAGQFGGLRLTNLNMLNILTQQMAIQNNIQANTADTVARLDTLLNKFTNYETGAKKLAVQ